MLTLTKEEAEALAADFPDEAFRLGAGGNPDLLYIEHAYLRERLNQVLGVGSAVPLRRREWAEKYTYINKYKQEAEAVRVYVDLVLLVRGAVVGEAIGDATYYLDNAATNYSDALESAKSNAMRRCCKEFGVGLQAWKKGWGEGWKQRSRGNAASAANPPAQTPIRPPQERPATPPPPSTPVPPPAKAQATGRLADSNRPRHKEKPALARPSIGHRLPLGR
jgi:hypothetical protein